MGRGAGTGRGVPGRHRFLWVLLVVCVVSLAAHLVTYPSLPERIPVHWGVDGNIDGYGPRWNALVLDAVPLLALLLFRVIPAVDPRREGYERSWPVWRGFVIAFTLFFVAFGWVAELACLGVIRDGGGIVGLLVCVTLGLALIVLGNYLPRVRQNYSFGIKTPWALADEHVWDRTHRMGGFVTVVWGLALIALGLVGRMVAPQVAGPVLAVVFVGGTAWLYLYSYLVFSKRLS